MDDSVANYRKALAILPDSALIRTELDAAVARQASEH
jgi:hypothetical protein